ncbi:hypothetical protein C8J56DRAFT_1084764 [Mycena floridula]|nr:hypothetical protein C8J56DRAFT_1084764 [Mycena floridula]
MPDPAMAQAIVEAYAKGIRTTFSYLLPAVISSAMLIPLLIMLFIVSTSQTRRKPIFLLNVAQILMGITTGILTAHHIIQAVLNPFAPTNTIENFAVSTLYMWMPWVTELVLLLRVVIVFRIRDRRILSMASLLALPLSLKAARGVINIFVLMNWWKVKGLTVDGVQFGTAESVDTWMAKASWIVEFIDNGYVSFLFLWRLKGQAHLFDGAKIGRVDTRRSITSKMKTLFWIASTNFFFPPVFLIFQIIFAFSGQGLILGSVNVTYTYVSIISTVFATVWSSTTSYAQTDTPMTLETRHPASVNHLRVPTGIFRRRPTMSSSVPVDDDRDI